VAHWLADGFPIEQQDLIRADDEMIAESATQCLRFGSGQALGELLGGFARLRGFVDIRLGALERLSKAFKQALAVG